MQLSWQEIRDRASKFAREWADETSEDAEAKSFWGVFFDVFGVASRWLASFEEPVQKADGKAASSTCCGRASGWSSASRADEAATATSNGPPRLLAMRRAQPRSPAWVVTASVFQNLTKS